MRNSTKLKHLLQINIISIDMDEDEKLHLTTISKKTHLSLTFEAKSFTDVIEIAHRSMMKEIKKEQKALKASIFYLKN